MRNIKLSERLIIKNSLNLKYYYWNGKLNLRIIKKQFKNNLRKIRFIGWNEITTILKIMYWRGSGTTIKQNWTLSEVNSVKNELSSESP